MSLYSNMATYRCRNAVKNLKAFLKSKHAFGLYFSAHNSALATSNEVKALEAVKYPPIREETILGRIEQRHQAWRDDNKRLGTVEEKLHHLVKGKEAYLFVMNAVSPRYDTLKLSQYCTRTHLIKNLPALYDEFDVDALYEHLQPHFEEAILLTHDHFSRTPKNSKHLEPLEKKRLLAQRMIDNIFRVINVGLADSYDHLKECTVDVDARVEAFWYCGNFHPTKYNRNYREKRVPYLKIPKDGPIDVGFQFIDKPHLQLRTKNSLKPVVSMNDPLCKASDVPQFPYNPSSVGIGYTYRYPTILPGFWPGDPYEFGHTSIYTCENVDKRKYFLPDQSDSEERMTECGLLASFAWLLGIATYQGFGPDTEISYPFVTQTIVTDGKNWSLFVYQLNTTSLYGKTPGLKFEQEPVSNKRNICWTSQPKQLFDSIKNGKVEGLNHELLKLLLKFFIQRPEDHLLLDSKPYLKGTKLNTEDWANMKNELRDWYSQRPPHRPKKEVFQWERIYLNTNSYVSLNPNRKRD